MRRVLFRIGTVTISSYPAMLYIGLVLGVAAGNYAANRAGLDSFRVFAATLVLIVPALMGARLLFVLLHWDTYRSRRRGIWQPRDTGAALFGGLPPALILSIPLLSALDIPFGAFWDVATFTILVALGIARIGCLLNGCCAGRPTNTRFSLLLPDHRGIWRRRVPYPPLEIGVATVLLVCAVLFWRRMPFDGALFTFVLGAYGAFRAAADTARDRSDHPPPDVLFHRIMPAAISGVCVVVLLFGR